ncbi:DUF2306 domain-containing protein [Nocardioides immobilis]|uniref:DUF2306 domain-containing protein n=1 Tax=Nocardioides immobilis TaxID=2049295 RepID=UPI0015FC1522|nr:DUF2306 domain-containing protein [Nocardioides immobilis]
MLALALLYAPIAISSMWFTVVPDAPRLQERVDAWVGGHAYAAGRGSVAALRSGAYVDHRVIMLVHTVLGGFALLVAALQCVTAHRLTRRVHRLVGRTYLALMGTSMGAAILFLLVSPRLDVAGQVAFRWQLWVLALSTVGTAVLATRSARQGDADAHRAWMALNIAFMLTAPVLRLLWTCLAPLFPRHDMLTNLEVGSVVLAVAAPAAGSLAVMARSGTPRDDRHPGVRHRWLPLVVLAVLGCVIVVVRQPGAGAGPGELPWFHAVPVLVSVAICVKGSLGSRNLRTRAQDWDSLLVGVALAPWAAVVVGIASTSWVGAAEGYLVGLMVAPGVPVVAALATVVRRRSLSGRAPIATRPASSADPADAWGTTSRLLRSRDRARCAAVLDTRP